jgi:mutator protein MutT
VMTTKGNQGLMVRPTAILIEDGEILLVRQEVTETRRWSLPGGKLESGETIEQCLIREVKEETGLDITIDELLYVCDRFYKGNQVVHMTFLVKRTGDRPEETEWTHNDPKPSGSSERRREIRMAPVNTLTDYGFTPQFQRLAEADFPERGSYKGDFSNVFGE